MSDLWNTSFVSFDRKVINVIYVQMRESIIFHEIIDNFKHFTTYLKYACVLISSVCLYVSVYICITPYVFNVAPLQRNYNSVSTVNIECSIFKIMYIVLSAFCKYTLKTLWFMRFKCLIYFILICFESHKTNIFVVNQLQNILH